MKIRELAKAAGVGIDTVRYYERQGLPAEPRRHGSGYRDYSATDARRLRFIRRAKALGFTLGEVLEPLAIAAYPGQGAMTDCPIMDAVSGGERAP